jgi:hypothetical protein
MSDVPNQSDESAKPSKEQVQILLDGLKSEAAKAGINADVEDQDDEIFIRIETPAEIRLFLKLVSWGDRLPFIFDVEVAGVHSIEEFRQFLNLMTCGDPTPFLLFDVYLAVKHLVDLVQIFLNHNEEQQNQPPAAT